MNSKFSLKSIAVAEDRAKPKIYVPILDSCLARESQLCWGAKIVTAIKLAVKTLYISHACLIEN